MVLKESDVTGNFQPSVFGTPLHHFKPREAHSVIADPCDIAWRNYIRYMYATTLNTGGRRSKSLQARKSQQKLTNSCGLKSVSKSCPQNFFQGYINRLPMKLLKGMSHHVNNFLTKLALKGKERKCQNANFQGVTDFRALPDLHIQKPAPHSKHFQYIFMSIARDVYFFRNALGIVYALPFLGKNWLQ